jgi:hypothetical protein
VLAAVALVVLVAEQMGQRQHLAHLMRVVRERLILEGVVLERLVIPPLQQEMVERVALE